MQGVRGSVMESHGVGLLQDLARAGRASQRGEQSREQQLPFEVFPLMVWFLFCTFVKL